MWSDDDPTGPDELSRAVGKVTKRTSGAKNLIDAVQKLGFGQQVDKIATFGPSGWRVEQVSRFKPKFKPRLGPVRGGGTVFAWKLGDGVEYIGRTGGRAGTNFVGRIEEGTNIAYSGLGEASKVLGRVGLATNLLGAGASCVDQWARDAGRPDIEETSERCVRAAYRGTVVTVAGVLGGVGGRMAGAATGAAIGSIIFPGPGTAIGGVLGRIAGAVGGGKAASTAAEAVADRTIDAVGKGQGDEFLEEIATGLEEFVEEVEDLCNDIAEEFIDAVGRARKWFSSLF